MHDLAMTIQILERTPRVLSAMLDGLSSNWTHHNYGPETWNAYQVVGHLVAAERDDWMPRLRRILQHGQSKPFDPFSHHATEADGTVPLAQLIETFSKLRAQSLQELAALKLTSADLERTGLHPALGPVTASQLLATWAVHDLHHQRQIALAMAWQYREAVGPWRDYLNTLKR
jgi:hypothetical protein